MPRTLAQNAQYIAETIKPAIKSAIEAQGVTVPSTDSFLDYADRIGEIEGGGSGYQLKDLPTGSISTVTDAAELPLNALKVSVEAVQSGSGTPSPSNIRPIIGWDSGEISVVGKNWLPNEIASESEKDVSFITQADGGIKIEGTASGNIYQTDICTNLSLPIGTYIFSGCDIANARLQICNRAENIEYGFIGTQQPTFTLNVTADMVNDMRVRPIINALTSVNGIVYPMIRLATETDSTYEPYQGKQYTQQFPTTIYGAEWDVVNGELGLKITDGFEEFDGSEAWEQDAINYYSLKVYLPTAWASDVFGQSNEYKYNGATSGQSGMNQEGMYWWYNNLLPDPNYRYLMIRDDNQNSLADFKQFLTQNPLQVRYKLATPTYVTLTGLSIRLLEGTNNLYADCGEILEGEYFVDEGAHRYQLYDYIESDGTQVIDLGFAPKNGDEITVNNMMLSAQSSSAWVWGATDPSIFIGVVQNTGNKSVYSNSGGGSTISYINNQLNTDTITANRDYTAPLCMFGFKLNGSYATGITTRIYLVKVNDNFYLPVKRISDGVFGLYDVTNQTFLTDSAGGNAFVGGNPIGAGV